MAKLPMFLWLEKSGIETPCYPLQAYAEELHLTAYGKRAEQIPCPCEMCGETYSVFTQEFAHLVLDAHVTLLETVEAFAEAESKERHPSNRGGAR